MWNFVRFKISSAAQKMVEEDVENLTTRYIYVELKVRSAITEVNKLTQRLLVHYENLNFEQCKRAWITSNAGL